jgi:hypothetical protein
LAIPPGQDPDEAKEFAAKYIKLMEKYKTKARDEFAPRFLTYNMYLYNSMDPLPPESWRKEQARFQKEMDLHIRGTLSAQAKPLRRSLRRSRSRLHR